MSHLKAQHILRKFRNGRGKPVFAAVETDPGLKEGSKEEPQLLPVVDVVYGSKGYIVVLEDPECARERALAEEAAAKKAAEEAARKAEEDERERIEKIKADAEAKRQEAEVDLAKAALDEAQAVLDALPKNATKAKKAEAQAAVDAANDALLALLGDDEGVEETTGGEDESITGGDDQADDESQPTDEPEPTEETGGEGGEVDQDQEPDLLTQTDPLKDE